MPVLDEMAETEVAASVVEKRRVEWRFLLIYRENCVNIQARNFESGNSSCQEFEFCRW